MNERVECNSILVWREPSGYKPFALSSARGFLFTVFIKKTRVKDLSELVNTVWYTGKKDEVGQTRVKSGVA